MSCYNHLPQELRFLIFDYIKMDDFIHVYSQSRGSLRTFFDNEPAAQVKLNKCIEQLLEQFPYILVDAEINYEYYPKTYNRTTRTHIELAFRYNKHPARVYDLHDKNIENYYLTTIQEADIVSRVYADQLKGPESPTLCWNYRMHKKMFM